MELCLTYSFSQAGVLIRDGVENDVFPPAFWLGTISTKRAGDVISFKS